MHFLHTTSIHSHGQLKSSNCVVDSRFVCKITDYGIHELRKPGPDDIETKESHEYWKSKLMHFIKWFLEVICKLGHAKMEDFRNSPCHAINSLFPMQNPLLPHLILFKAYHHLQITPL